MAFDVGRDEWAGRDHLKFFRSGVVQSCFRQLGRDPLSPVVFRYFSMEQIEPAIGLRVIDLCDLPAKGSFKAVGSFVSADWMIEH